MAKQRNPGAKGHPLFRKAVRSVQGGIAGALRQQDLTEQCADLQLQADLLKTLCAEQRKILDGAAAIEKWGTYDTAHRKT